MNASTASLRRFFLPATTAASSLVLFKTSCEGKQSQPRQEPKLLFLGTGSSTGCPKPLCTMIEKGAAESIGWNLPCSVSKLAIEGDPKTNKNYRNNPSLLITHCKGGECKNVVIDVGKTFRETSLRWLPMNGISSLDGVVLTHQHMDAAAGLDEIRGFQTMHRVKDKDSNATSLQRVSMPLYLSQFTLDEVSSQFPWLFPKLEKPKNDGKPVVQRHVASFNVNIFEPFVPFQVAGLEMIPLPVWHGDDLISYGFAFSIENEKGSRTNVVYISDISRMMPETLEFIQNRLHPTDIMVVDALLLSRKNPVHFNLDQALELIRQVRPKQAYLVGMNCDSFKPHDEMNEELSTLGDVNVQLAHDGLVINL